MSEDPKAMGKVNIEELEPNVEELSPEMAGAVHGGLKGDTNTDGVPDIIVGAGPGAPGGHVK